MEKDWKGNIVFINIMVLLFLGISSVDKFIAIFQSYSIIGAKSFSIFPIIIFKFIVYCIAGMVFGLEKFFSEKNKKGSWNINFPKVMVAGFSSLILGTVVIISYIFTFIPPFLNFTFFNSSLFISFMQMLFGYVLITSFYKSE